MEITYRGSAICSYSLLMRSAILKVTVPATIMTSACLGDARGAMPNRSMSYTVDPVTINSNAQHAMPNDMGNIDERRAQLIRSTSAATMTPPTAKPLSNNPFIILLGFSSPPAQRKRSYISLGIGDLYSVGRGSGFTQS